MSKLKEKKVIKDSRISIQRNINNQDIRRNSQKQKLTSNLIDQDNYKLGYLKSKTMNINMKKNSFYFQNAKNQNLKQEESVKQNITEVIAEENKVRKGRTNRKENVTEKDNDVSGTNPLEENAEDGFKSNDFHQNFSFKMIKQANLESFFILMDTKNERLMHNSYLNRTLEKTDFFFPNIPKAFFVKPTEMEQKQMINLLNVPVTTAAMLTNPSQLIESGEQKTNEKIEKKEKVHSQSKGKSQKKFPRRLPQIRKATSRCSK